MTGPRLKDLGRWFSGGTPPSDRAEYWDGDVPWLSGKDFDKTVLREPTKFTTEEGAALHSRLMPGGQTVLLLVRGMALAHGLPVVRLPFDAAINQDVRGLRVRTEFDPDFIYYALVGRRAELDAHIDRAAHGTARLQDKVYAHRIGWMTALAAQREIAHFLDRECARAGEALQRQQALHSAVLSSLWSPIDDLVESAPTQRLKFCLQGVVDTEHATCPTYEDGTIPVIRTPDVRDGTLRLDGALRTDESGWRQWTHRRVPQTGDVVFTREAPIGEAAVVPPDTRLCIGQRSVLLLIDGEKALPDFVVASLYSRPVRDEIDLRGRSTTTAHLNVGEIGELPVPDLPVDQQEAVVDVFRRRREAVAGVTSVGIELAEALAAYRDSLIHEAVTGKLDVTKVSERQMDERLHAAAEDRLDEVPA